MPKSAPHTSLETQTHCGRRTRPSASLSPGHSTAPAAGGIATCKRISSIVQLLSRLLTWPQAMPVTPTAPAAGGPATRKRHGFFVGPAADVLAQQDQAQLQQQRHPPKRRKLSNSSASSVDTGDAADPSLEAESLAPPGARRNGARNGEQAGPQQFRNVVHELQDQGLPVEMHYVRTQDGYWLPIVRVPLRGEGAGACGVGRGAGLRAGRATRARGLLRLTGPGCSLCRCPCRVGDGTLALASSRVRGLTVAECGVRPPGCSAKLLLHWSILSSEGAQLAVHL